MPSAKPGYQVVKVKVVPPSAKLLFTTDATNAANNGKPYQKPGIEAAEGATVRLFAEKRTISRELSIPIPMAASKPDGSSAATPNPDLPATVNGRGFSTLLTRSATYRFLASLPDDARLQKVQAKVTLAATDNTVTLTWDGKTRLSPAQVIEAFEFLDRQIQSGEWWLRFEQVHFTTGQVAASMAGRCKHQDRARADQPMNTHEMSNFGILDDMDNGFEFWVAAGGENVCRLVAVVQTERGPRRTEVAVVPAEIWRSLATSAAKELVSGMGESERKRSSPAFREGGNLLSPLVGRELGVLLIALMEKGAADRIDAMLHAWRELAREERWWLYGKAAAPGQRPGVGWRRALFHALSETSETRTAPLEEAQKKNSGNTTKNSSTKTNPQSLPTCRTQRRAMGEHPRTPRFRPKETGASARAKPKKRPKRTSR